PRPPPPAPPARGGVADPGSDEDELPRRLVVAKYQPTYGGDLSGWRRSALPVAADLDQGPTGEGRSDGGERRRGGGGPPWPGSTSWSRRPGASARARPGCWRATGIRPPRGAPRSCGSRSRP